MITGIVRNYANCHLRQLLYTHTGSGKTDIACIAQRVWASGQLLKPGTIPYFILERATLVKQAKAGLEGLGFKVGIFQGENTCRRRDEDAVVTSVQVFRQWQSRYKFSLRHSLQYPARVILPRPGRTRAKDVLVLVYPVTAEQIR